MPEAAWHPDPTGRHEQRYWDGTRWTEHVADGGSTSTDPLDATPRPQATQDSTEPTLSSGHALGATVDAPRPAVTRGAAPAAGRGVGGGLMGDGYDEEDVERVGLQNSKMLKIRLGGPVMIKRGSMVAYQGQMSFEAVSEGGGVGSLLKRAVSDNALMARAEGHGDLFLADNADQVHLLQLDGGSLMVNGPNLLAFEHGIAFETVRFKGAGLVTGGGLFGMKLTGSGWVAVTCHGTPVRLDTDGQTFVDSQAAVAWSAETQMTLNVQKLGFRSMRSGELVQLQFGPGGFVLVQASEGPTVPPHSHGG